MKFLKRIGIAMSIAMLLTTCSKNMSLCESESAILLENGGCLLIEDTQLSAVSSLIEQVVKGSINEIHSVMPIDGVNVRIVSDRRHIIPEIGVGGFNPNENELLIAIDAQSSILTDVIEENLPFIVAHEAHHAKRRRSVGYGNTLLKAMITEGLADHFAMEITGQSPPPWSTALSDNQLDYWLAETEKTWNDEGYNHGNWFLGFTTDIPRWTGYTIGFELVNNYLNQHPDAKPSGLSAEPANSFIF